MNEDFLIEVEEEDEPLSIPLRGGDMINDGAGLTKLEKDGKLRDVLTKGDDIFERTAISKYRSNSNRSRNAFQEFKKITTLEKFIEYPPPKLSEINETIIFFLIYVSGIPRINTNARATRGLAHEDGICLFLSENISLNSIGLGGFKTEVVSLIMAPLYIARLT